MSYFPENPTLNEEQQAIVDGKYNKTINGITGVIVKGAAGTGKTMTAIHLAKKLSKEGTVGVILYTKSLRSFIKDAINSKSVDVFNVSWEELDENHYDYLIIDEVQDFNMLEIRRVVNHRPKAIYFFGDDGQQILEFLYEKETQAEYLHYASLTNEQQENYESPYQRGVQCTQNETGFDVVEMSKNIRLSSPNIEFINGTLSDFRLSVTSTQNESILPEIYICLTLDAEKDKVRHLIENKIDGSIGILLYDNKSVNLYYDYLKTALFNMKINLGRKGDLKFANGSVNVLTYHSSKGLEFDTIILPEGGRGNSPEGGSAHQKLLYVGCTRARKSIIITCAGQCFFSDVSQDLYRGDFFTEEQKNIAKNQKEKIKLEVRISKSMAIDEEIEYIQRYEKSLVDKKNKIANLRKQKENLK